VEKQAENACCGWIAADNHLLQVHVVLLGITKEKVGTGFRALCEGVNMTNGDSCHEFQWKWGVFVITGTRAVDMPVGSL
jgi:hypothetical protein